MQRRSRLAVIEDIIPGGKLRIKDRITGEILDIQKITQRLRDGIYSSYQVHQLNLALGESQKLSA